MAGKVWDPHLKIWVPCDSQNVTRQAWMPPAPSDPSRARKRRGEIRRAKLTISFYLMVIFAGIVAALAIITGLPYERLTVREFNATVTSQLLCGPEKTKYCVVVMKDDGREEVLQNGDSLWWWKWNSADYQARLQPGQRFRFKVFGWRLPLFSSFRNIISAEPIG